MEDRAPAAAPREPRPTAEATAQHYNKKLAPYYLSQLPPAPPPPDERPSEWTAEADAQLDAAVELVHQSDSGADFVGAAAAADGGEHASLWAGASTASSFDVAQATEVSRVCQRAHRLLQLLLQCAHTSVQLADDTVLYVIYGPHVLL